MNWRPGLQFSTGTRDYSLLHNVQTAYETHRFFSWRVRRTLFWQVKQRGLETGHSPKCGVEVNWVEVLTVHAFVTYTGTTSHLPVCSVTYITISRSQWPRGLMRRSVASRLLRLWARIPPGAWMFVCCECCVLSGRGPCDELITRPEESCRLWCVVECDLKASRMRRPWPTEGCCAK